MSARQSGSTQFFLIVSLSLVLGTACSVEDELHEQATAAKGGGGGGGKGGPGGGGGGQTCADGSAPPCYAPVPAAPIGLGSGAQQSCAVRPDGSVACWGKGLSVATVAGLDSADSVAVGADHACALRSDATVWCWGENDAGQLGLGSTSSSAAALPVAISDVVSIAAGDRHTCAATSDGAVRCWGDNARGQLGAAGPNLLAPASPISGLSGALEVTAGRSHSCARLDSGEVRCWGAGDLGQLGDGAAADSTAPVVVSGASSVIKVSAGGDSSCAVSTSGAVSCWGDNAVGQLSVAARRPRSNYTSAQASFDGVNAVDIEVADAGQVCVLADDGAALCAGDRSDLSNAPWSERVTAVAGGVDHSCVQADGGRVFCWGDNAQAQLGRSNASVSAFAQADLLHLDFNLQSWAAAGAPIAGNASASLPTVGAVAPQISGLPTALAVESDGLIWGPTTAADIGSYDVTVTVSAAGQTIQLAQTLVITGVQVQASGVIGPAGGTLEVTDPQSPLFGARLDLPAGAVVEDVNLGIGIVDAAPSETVEGTRVGPTLELLPAGMWFAQPVTLTVPYDAAQIPASLDEADLRIEQYVPLSVDKERSGAESLETEAATVDTASKILTATLEHFSTYEPRVRPARANGWNIFDSHLGRFSIKYATDPSNPDAPLSDTDYSEPNLEPGQPARLDGVPDYVEDLAFYLETAYDAYEAMGYELKSHITVKLKKLDFSEDGRTKGRGFFPNMYIDSTTWAKKTEPNEVTERLKMGAAHELFHMIQMDAMTHGTLGTNIVVGWAQASIHAFYFGTKWMMEATAAHMAYEVFDHDPSTWTYYNANFFLEEQSVIDSEGTGGYGSFMLFRFLKARYEQPSNFQFNIVWDLYNPNDPLIATAQPLNRGKEIVYDYLAAKTTDPVWHLLAVGAHYKKTDVWVDGIESWGGVPAANKTVLQGDEFSPIKLTRAHGYREIPAGGVQVYPVNFDNALANIGLDPASVTFKLRPLIDGNTEAKIWVINTNDPSAAPMLLIDNFNAEVTLEGNLVGNGWELLVTVVRDWRAWSGGYADIEFEFDPTCIGPDCMSCNNPEPIPGTACAYECQIDVNTGASDCAGAVTVDSVANQRARLTVNMAGYTSLELITDVCSPSGNWLNVADSPTCDGGGGDGSTSSNDAELHVADNNTWFFGNDYAQANLGAKLLASDTSMVITSCEQRSFYFADQRFQSDAPCMFVDSPYALRLNPPADAEGTPDAVWYVGLNRVVADYSNRVGAGIQSATLCLR